MKKIVGILAVAAMATSMFAADVSAKVKLTGSILNYDGDVSAMKLNNHQSHNWEPDLALSTSTDNAGATVKFKTMNEWGSGEGETTTDWNIWFKPMDMLKVNIGTVDVALNKETIDWSSVTSVASAGGYGVEVNTNGIFVGAYLDMGWDNSWFVKDTIAKTSAKFAYSADFGTISAMFVMNDKDNLEVGAGFANSSFVEGLSFFVDAKFVKAAANSVVADAFAAYSNGALTVKGYVNPTISLDGGDPALKIKARVDYRLDACNIFAVVLDDDIIGKGNLVIKPGVSGNVGICGWECRAEITAPLNGGDVSEAVPVEFTVNF